jgi:hypothetical protein
VRRLLFLAIPFLLLTAGGTVFVERAQRTSCKPVAPIDVEASIVGDPSGEFGVSAKATSRTGIEVDLEVVLPHGVTHVAGERKKRGRQCDLQVGLRASDRTRKEIAVVATITDGQGARLVRTVPLVLFDAQVPAAQGRPGRDRRGNPIQVFSP